jgi:hypothetical protein
LTSASQGPLERPWPPFPRLLPDWVLPLVQDRTFTLLSGGVLQSKETLFRQFPRVRPSFNREPRSHLITAAIVLMFASLARERSRTPYIPTWPTLSWSQSLPGAPQARFDCDVFTSSVSVSISMSAPADLFKLKSPARISQVASRIDCWFATQGLVKLRTIFGHDLSPQSLRTTERHGVTSSAKRSARLSNLSCS